MEEPTTTTTTESTSHHGNTPHLPSSPTSKQQQQSPPNDPNQQQQQQQYDARFNCNICLDPVNEPVVTRCGHLYCWTCLYIWLKPGITSSESLDVFHPSVASSSSLVGSIGGGGGGGNGVSLRGMYNRRNQYHYGGVTTSSGSRLEEVDESRRCCPVCKSSVSIKTVVPIYVRTEPTATTITAMKKGSITERKEEKTEEYTAAEGEVGDATNNAAAPATENAPISVLRRRRTQNTSSSSSATTQEETVPARPPPPPPPMDELLTHPQQQQQQQQQRHHHYPNHYHHNPQMIMYTHPSSSSSTSSGLSHNTTTSLQHSLFSTLFFGTATNRFNDMGSNGGGDASGVPSLHRVYTPPFSSSGRTLNNHSRRDNSSGDLNVSTNSDETLNMSNTTTTNTARRRNNGQQQQQQQPQASVSSTRTTSNRGNASSSMEAVGVGGVGSSIDETDADYLSRLLLVLGSFVILMLLLF